MDELKRRKILLGFLYSLFVILLIVLTFFSVTWLLKKGETLKPSEVSGEFPVSVVSTNFPPGPRFIEIAELYFNGPFLLKDNDIIDRSAIFSILCKKDDEYDIIYIGDIEQGIQVSAHIEYQCWLDNCADYNNLYAAIFWTPLQKYSYGARQTVKQVLEEMTNPPCPIPIKEP